MSSRVLSRTVLLLTLAAMASSCGDGSSPSGPTEPDGPPSSNGFNAQIQPIFDAQCVRCHVPGIFGFEQTGGGDQNGLDLSRGRSWSSLVDRPTFQEPGQAPTLRVDPGSPDNSYLIEKIVAGPKKAGQRMPLLGPFLSDAEVQLIRDWIARGAPND